MGAYARLAKLPRPHLAPVEVGAWIRQVAEPGAAPDARWSSPGPEMKIRGDRDQLEQLLINLLRNAVDASLETGGGVTVVLEPRRDRTSRSRSRTKARG